MESKHIMWIIIVGLISFWGAISIIALSNGSFEFQIDNDTKEAIELMSQYNNSYVVVNQYAEYDCVKGCELMHEAIVSYDGAAGQQGKDGKYYYASDCPNMCKREALQR